MVQIVKRPGEDVLVASGRDAELFYVAKAASMSATSLTVRFGPEFNVRTANAIKLSSSGQMYGWLPGCQAPQKKRHCACTQGPGLGYSSGYMI